jgi:hypothetical protein
LGGCPAPFEKLPCSPCAPACRTAPSPPASTFRCALNGHRALLEQPLPLGHWRAGRAACCISSGWGLLPPSTGAWACAWARRSAYTETMSRCGCLGQPAAPCSSAGYESTAMGGQEFVFDECNWVGAFRVTFPACLAGRAACSSETLCCSVGASLG